MGKGNNAKGATGRKKIKIKGAAGAPSDKKAKVKGPSPGRIEKRKHARAEGSSGGRKRLAQKLQAQAPKAASAAASSSLKQKRRRQKNAGALGAVAGMQGSLEELIAASEARVQERVAKNNEEEEAKSSKKSLSSKRRQEMVAEESAHLRDVLSHPAFQANPFAALQEHLANTVGQPSEKEERKSKGKGKSYEARGKR